MREQTIQASTYAMFNHGKNSMIVPEVGLLMQDKDEDKPKQTSLYIYLDDQKLLKFAGNSKILNQY